MCRKIKNKGFTLIEIIIVVTLLGLAATIGISYYNKTIEISRARDAIVNLSAIHSKNEINRIRTGEYWPNGTGFDVSQINTNLELNIVEDGVVYSCDGDTATFTCTAKKTPSATFTVTVNEDPISNTNPLCQGDNCP